MSRLSGEDMLAIATAIYNKSFGGERHMREDLISEGVMGLMRADGTFDEKKGVKFSTYAWRCAEKQMRDYVAREEKMERLKSEATVDEVEEFVGVDGEYEDIFRLPQMEKIGGAIRRMKTNSGSKAKCVAYELLKNRKQREVAEEFGVSRQYVSLVFNNIKKKVREMYKYEHGEMIRR